MAGTYNTGQVAGTYNTGQVANQKIVSTIVKAQSLKKLSIFKGTNGAIINTYGRATVIVLIKEKLIILFSKPCLFGKNLLFTWRHIGIITECVLHKGGSLIRMNTVLEQGSV